MNLSGLVGGELADAAVANEPQMQPTIGRQEYLSVHHYQQQQQHQPLANPSRSLPALLARNLVSALNSGLQESVADEYQRQQVGTEQTTITTTTTTINSGTISSVSNTFDMTTATDKQQQLTSVTSNSIGDWWSDYWSRQPFPSGYTQSSITLIACVLTTIIFLIVVGNLLVCIAIFTEKSLKPTQNWFIASLAVSDMLLGLVVMPFSLARELMGFWIFGPLWCDIHEAIDVLLTTASINTLCLISLDRYWSITQAVSYLKKRTPRRGAFMIAFVWFFSAAVSLPPLFGWKKQSPSILGQNSTTTTTATATTKPPSNANPASVDSFADGRQYRQKQQQQQQSARDEQEDEQRHQSEETRNREDDDWPPAPASGRRKARQVERRAAKQQRRSARPNRKPDELATPILGSLYQSASLLRRRAVDETAGSFQLGSIAGGPPDARQPIAQQQPPTGASQSADLAAEYPSCQLSDDVGYVLYSALGSFYIPCAVMVFTYIKIFLAARSRARRTINKQSRGTGQSGGGRRAQLAARSANPAADGPAPNSGLSNNITSCGSVLVSPSVVHSLAAGSPPERPPPEPVMKGKIVIVERRKSLAPAAPKPLELEPPQQQQVQVREPGAPDGDKTSAKLLVDTNNSNEDPLSQHQAPCTLITSGAKQASPNTLTSSASNDSSMITVMNASMAEVPVTRFNFQSADMIVEKCLSSSAADESAGEQAGNQKPPDTKPSAAAEESRRAALLLKAISEAGQDELMKEALSLDGADNHLPLAAAAANAPVSVPDIVVERRDRSLDPHGAEADAKAANQGAATNETCFMTIEEDSDMFDAQTGRTIMMIAGNASQKQANSLTKAQSGAVMMTMMPSGGISNNVIVCNNVLCRRSQHHLQARSGSSYCGSSMTINDDDIDECVDDELLTDDCNGYSVSCALDQYCPTSSGCIHCHECQRELNSSSALNRGSSLEEGDSPLACQQQTNSAGATATKATTGSVRPHNRQEPAELETQSITGDGDNVSHLTEYRSQEDSSSIVGHDVLDATEAPDYRHGEKKHSVAGQSGEARKMSIIGFRLARLGGGGGSVSEQPSDLMLLASSQHQQQQQQQQFGGTRNLKALRQNFFFKLNQLTAKSSAKSESKQKKAPSTGKSSAHSSGTSHDASVDCATTSNVHSTEYHQSTTGGETDDFEQADTSKAQQQRDIMAKTTVGQQSSAELLMKDDCLQGNKQPADKQTPYKSDDRALLLHSSQSNDRNANRRSPSNNSMLVAQTNANNNNKSQRSYAGDLEKRGNKQQVAGIGGQMMIHNPTILSTNTATGGVGSGTSRAYLASDNERHKRKLAKARERRATLILGLIMTTFVCSWLPFFTFYVLRALCNSCREYIPPRFEAFIFWMGYCNSAINPIIYTIFNRDFRKAFRKILFKCL